MDSTFLHPLQVSPSLRRKDGMSLGTQLEINAFVALLFITKIPGEACLSCFAAAGKVPLCQSAVSQVILSACATYTHSCGHTCNPPSL
jgi:hypothetical protein